MAAAKPAPDKQGPAAGVMTLVAPLVFLIYVRPILQAMER
jgi:hypothetical protein